MHESQIQIKTKKDGKHFCLISTHIFFCWLSKRLSTLLELCVHFSRKKLIIQTGLSRRRQSKWRLKREATLFIFLTCHSRMTQIFITDSIWKQKIFSLCAHTQGKLSGIFISRGKLFVKIERDAKQFRGCLFIRLLPTRSDSECFSPNENHFDKLIWCA